MGLAWDGVRPAGWAGWKGGWTRPGIQCSGWGVPVGERREREISSQSIDCGRRVFGESAIRGWLVGRVERGERHA